MSENTESKTITTAEALGKFRMELNTQRFDRETIEHLVLKAADSLLDYGLVVKA